MSVDNATSHEEGGFVSYLNFGSHIAGEDYSVHGLPLYFDNDLGRLYSRPAWLTGHSLTPGDGYDERIVPWLVYDYKTEDANLNGGNNPWKGFSSGKVKLSISAKGISNTADVIVTSVNGNVELNNPWILAPMAGVCDLPFRLLCRRKGAGAGCACRKLFKPPDCPLSCR